jgi:hypothetical protein
LSEDAPTSRLDIADGPGDEGEPEGHQIGDTNRQEKLYASCGGLNHERCPLGQPARFSVTAKLSVPDTLEPPDWKHKYAGSAGALLRRTGDPELRLPGKWAQRLDASGTSAGPGSHERQDITYLIVIDASDQCCQTRVADGGVSLDLSGGGPNRGQI